MGVYLGFKIGPLGISIPLGGRGRRHCYGRPLSPAALERKLEREERERAARREAWRRRQARADARLEQAKRRSLERRDRHRTMHLDSTSLRSHERAMLWWEALNYALLLRLVGRSRADAYQRARIRLGLVDARGDEWYWQQKQSGIRDVTVLR